MLKTVSSVTNALGALVYQGTWDANANSPTLTSSVGTKGNYYVVSVAGTTTLNGISLWSVGDWAVFNGSVWQKVDGGSSEAFVNLTVSGTANIATGNVTNLVSGNVTITGGSENAVTYTNVTVSSGNITVTNANLTYANIVTALRTQGLTGYLYGNDNTGNVSAATTIPNAGLANSTATLGNTTITLGSTTTSVGNLTLTNVTVSSGNVTANLSTSTSIPVANATGTLATTNGGTGLTSFTANAIVYSTSTSALSTNSSFTFNGTSFIAPNFQATSSGYPYINSSAYYVDGGYAAWITGTSQNGFSAITFTTGSTERVRIFNSGGVSIGNTTDPGAGNLIVNGFGYFGTTSSSGSASNSTNVVGGVFSTASGSVSASNNTATTLVTLPNLGTGVFIATVSIPGASGASAYAATALITTQGTTSVVSTLHSASNMSLSMSDLNLQGTQTGGTTYTLSWTLIRLT